MNPNNFIWIDALDKHLSNGENRRSLSGTYQKLFKKYPPFFFFEMDNRWMTIIVGTDIIIHLAMEIIHFSDEREKEKKKNS